MTEVSPGDLVFSYSETYIRAVGVVQKRAVTAPKPDFDGAGTNWLQEGWYVEADFLQVKNPIQPKQYMSTISNLLPDKYSPLMKSGRGLQGVYLTEISRELSALLLSLSEVDLKTLSEELGPVVDNEVELDIELEVKARNIEGDLEKIELVKSRRGQGIFNANVRLFENRCRVTGVSNIKHLRASHIKPWAVADDDEKIDGCNGLLLSPHVDHLFDRGFITFEKSGDLRILRHLPEEVLELWSIPKYENVGNFRQKQAEYLEYHQEVIFQS